jgi:hypothetical protein
MSMHRKPMGGRLGLRLSGLLVTVTVLPVFGQSVNIDFGDGAGTPSSTYAAAGRAGVWNASPTGDTFSLVGLDGLPIPATLSMVGGFPPYSHSDHPGTFGDDERLLDDFYPVSDMLRPTWFEGLQRGEYHVFVYALGPTVEYSTGVCVDEDCTECAVGQLVTGAWTGELVEGVTHAHLRFSVDSGALCLRALGMPFGSSGVVSGVQLVGIDCNSNGLVDGEDIAVGTSQDCDGNYVPDECEFIDCNSNGVFDACDVGGDFDGNGQVELADFMGFEHCFTGACSQPPCVPALYLDPCCLVGDYDRDGDLDLQDFASFQRGFAEIPP